MPKYQETIEVMNPFDDGYETVDVEYETNLHKGEIFCVTDMVLTSKTQVVLDKTFFGSQYLEEVEERLLDRAIEMHGGE